MDIPGDYVGFIRLFSNPYKAFDAHCMHDETFWGAKHA